MRNSVSKTVKIQILRIRFLRHYESNFSVYNEKTTGGQRLNPNFVSDIEKKVLSRTVEMETDQTFNEGLARLGRSGFHLLRGRNFLH